MYILHEDGIKGHKYSEKIQWDGNEQATLTCWSLKDINV